MKKIIIILSNYYRNKMDTLSQNKCKTCKKEYEEDKFIYKYPNGKVLISKICSDCREKRKEVRKTYYYKHLDELRDATKKSKAKNRRNCEVCGIFYMTDTHFQTKRHLQAKEYFEIINKFYKIN